MPATATRKPRRRTGRRLFTVIPSHTKSATVGSYNAALDRAMSFEADRLCDKIEIFKAGTPLQWWTRNYQSGDWDFHGLLFEGGK